jgi:hypothetical protein
MMIQEESRCGREDPCRARRIPRLAGLARDDTVEMRRTAPLRTCGMSDYASLRLVDRRWGVSDWIERVKACMRATVPLRAYGMDDRSPLRKKRQLPIRKCRHVENSLPWYLNPHIPVQDFLVILQGR